MTTIDDKIRAAIAAHEAAHHLEIRVGAAAVEHVAVMEKPRLYSRWCPDRNARFCLNCGEKYELHLKDSVCAAWPPASEPAPRETPAEPTGTARDLLNVTREQRRFILDRLDELEVFVSGHDWLDDIATMRRYLGVDESGALPVAAPPPPPADPRAGDAPCDHSGSGANDGDDRGCGKCGQSWASLLSRPAVTVTPAPAPQHCTADNHTVACVEVAKASQAAGEGAECIEEGAPQSVSGEVAPFYLITCWACFAKFSAYAIAGHIEQCPRHPLAKAIAEVTTLRARVAEHVATINDLAARLDETAAFGARQSDLARSIADERDALRARVAELEASRRAYASEFPPGAEGEPDVGSIHENIRRLKAERAALESNVVAAVESVPTSVSLERELTKATAIFEPRPAVGMGLGLFAVVNIPAGTLLWSPAGNERKFAYDDVDSLDAATREALYTYGVDGPDGLLWLYEGPEKYLNHSCDPNVTRMADGVEVASRDIAAGDQLGIDYADYAGRWSKGWSMDCRCGAVNCRGVIRPNEDSALAAASRASKE